MDFLSKFMEIAAVGMIISIGANLFGLTTIAAITIIPMLLSLIHI